MSRIKLTKMKTLATQLIKARNNVGLKLKEVAQLSSIDQALVSKFEHGKRIPTKEQLKDLARALSIDFEMLERARLAEKIVQMVQYEELALDALQIAEERIEYLTSSKTFEVESLNPDILQSLDRIDNLKNQWASKKPLKGTQLQKLKEYFKIKYTYDSNQIEGNTLTYQETHLVVNDGITIGGKSMREHLEAVNHAEAVDFLADIIAKKEPLTERILLELHGLILKGIDRENAGRYRKIPVAISGSEHKPTEPYLVPKLMEDYFIHFNLLRNKMHPVILAAEMHERLVTIHPFADGNGRTSRLIMNMILLANGYTLASLKGSLNDRLEYYRALEKVQVDNDPQMFYQLICKTVESSLNEHLALT